MPVVAVTKPAPHSVDLIRTLIEFQEPNWHGWDARADGAALVTEARMRMHIDARVDAMNTHIDGQASATAPTSRVRQRDRAL